MSVEYDIEAKASYIATDLAQLYNDEAIGWISQKLIEHFGELDAYDIAERLLQCVEHDTSAQ